MRAENTKGSGENRSLLLFTRAKRVVGDPPRTSFLAALLGRSDRRFSLSSPYFLSQSHEASGSRCNANFTEPNEVAVIRFSPMKPSASRCNAEPLPVGKRARHVSVP